MDPILLLPLAGQGAGTLQPRPPGADGHGSLEHWNGYFLQTTVMRSAPVSLMLHALISSLHTIVFRIDLPCSSSVFDYSVINAVIFQ